MEKEVNIERKKIGGNKWLSLMSASIPDLGIKDYTYMHHNIANGKTVAVLPFRQGDDGYEFLLIEEMRPIFSAEKIVSSLTGIDDEETPEDTAIKEIKEEAGFIVDKESLISLGLSLESKASDTIYHIYAVDVTGLEQIEPSKDGSHLEQFANYIWTDDPVEISDDPLVGMMFARVISKVLNIIREKL